MNHQFLELCLREYGSCWFQTLQAPPAALVGECFVHVIIFNLLNLGVLVRERQLAVDVGVSTVCRAVLLARLQFDRHVVGEVQYLVHRGVVGHFYLVELLNQGLLIFFTVSCR